MSTTPSAARPILIVDDDAGLAALIATALTRDGFAVATCADSREALRQVDALHPLAIILDVRMPHLDGWSVLRALRATPAGSRLPVVLVSGAWRAVERHHQIGATTTITPTVVLPKPFALDDLTRSLHALHVVPV
jgi:DNA-binding response OmpR family regulator